MDSSLPEPIAVTLLVIDVLEELGLPYVLAGSFASAQYGTARSTLDSDLVVQLNEFHVSLLTARLREAFYVDENLAEKAVQEKSSFNLIHLETMFKVDIFIAKDELFDRIQIERRVPSPVAKDRDREIYVQSAEDTILAKLRWYRLGGEQSERQWRDVVGIVKVQGERLDFKYLHRMAAELEIDDLLARLAG